MINRRAAKARARELMATARPSAFRASLLISAIVLAASAPYLFSYIQPVVGPDGELLALTNASLLTTFLDILSTLVGWLAAAGLASFLLATHRQQLTSYSMLEDGLGIAGKVIWLDLRIAVQTALWGMLFVIPGVIAAYRYRFALYCLLDDPTLTAGEALRRSCEKTNGWKMELFVLDLSFVGWNLLCVGVPIGVSAALGVLLLPILGIFGLMGLMLLASLLPVSWLQAYVSLTDIAYCRTAVPDSPAETAPAPGAPWDL